MISAYQPAITHKEQLNNSILFPQIQTFVHITGNDVSVFFSVGSDFLPFTDLLDAASRAFSGPLPLRFSPIPASPEEFRFQGFLLIGRAASLAFLLGLPPAVFRRPTTSSNCRLAGPLCNPSVASVSNTRCQGSCAVNFRKPSARYRWRSRPFLHSPLEAPPFLFLVYTIACLSPFVNKNLFASIYYVFITSCAPDNPQNSLKNRAYLQNLSTFSSFVPQLQPRV